VTLELSKLTGQMGAMGEEVAAREQQYGDLVALARRWLAEYADQGEELRHPARHCHAAIPTDENLDAVHRLPSIPERFTFIAADGTQIQPDRHGAALYYLINVGSIVYRHGSGQAPEAHSQPTLGYTEADIYENGLLVAGNLLDVRRDLAEITCLADLCTAEPPSPTVAVVDGTLILWVLEDMPPDGRQRKITEYLHQLDRIRDTGASVAAFISRPRRGEVARLLHLANVGGDVNRTTEEPNPLQHLPDRAIFGWLPPGARSALFASSTSINCDHYQPAGHDIHFCYVNLALEDHEAIIARVEFPAWVAQNVDRLALVHGAIVAQARITGDYPYALVRADELAFIGGPEREALESMIVTALMDAGVRTALSPKRYYKTLTRQGRRKRRR
jgi:hypothetical protein